MFPARPSCGVVAMVTVAAKWLKPSPWIRQCLRSVYTDCLLLKFACGVATVQGFMSDQINASHTFWWTCGC